MGVVIPPSTLFGAVLLFVREDRNPSNIEKYDYMLIHGHNQIRFLFSKSQAY